MTVSAYGYEPPPTAVTVVADATTTDDVVLSALPVTEISGTVTDGSGHGWPLYARIDIAGVPRRAGVHRPGHRRLLRRAGRADRLHLHGHRPRARATTRRSRDVTVPPDSTTQDFALEVGCRVHRARLHLRRRRRCSRTSTRRRSPTAGRSSTTSAAARGGGSTTPATGATSPVATARSPSSTATSTAPDGGQDTELITTEARPLRHRGRPCIRFKLRLQRLQRRDRRRRPQHRRRRHVDQRVAGRRRGRDRRPAGATRPRRSPSPRRPARATCGSASTTTTRTSSGGGRSTTSSSANPPASRPRRPRRRPRHRRAHRRRRSTAPRSPATTSRPTRATTGADAGRPERRRRASTSLFSSLTRLRTRSPRARAQYGIEHRGRDGRRPTPSCSRTSPSAAGQLVVDPERHRREHRHGRLHGGRGSPSRTRAPRPPASSSASAPPGSRSPRGQTGAPARRVSGTFSPLRFDGSTPGRGTPAACRRRAGRGAVGGHRRPCRTTIMDNLADAHDGLVYSVGGFDGANNLAVRGRLRPAPPTRWDAIADMADRAGEAHRRVHRRPALRGRWLGQRRCRSCPSWRSTTPPPTPGPPAPTGRARGRRAAPVVARRPALHHRRLRRRVRHRRGVDATTRPTTRGRRSPATPRTPRGRACGAIDGRIYCGGGTAGDSELDTAYVYDPTSDAWSPIAVPAGDAVGRRLRRRPTASCSISGGVTDNFATVTNEGFAYDPGPTRGPRSPTRTTTCTAAGRPAASTRSAARPAGSPPPRPARSCPASTCAASRRTCRGCPSTRSAPRSAPARRVTVDGHARRLGRRGRPTRGLPGRDHGQGGHPPRAWQPGRRDDERHPARHVGQARGHRHRPRPLRRGGRAPGRGHGHRRRRSDADFVPDHRRRRPRTPSGWTRPTCRSARHGRTRTDGWRATHDGIDIYAGATTVEDFDAAPRFAVRVGHARGARAERRAGRVDQHRSSPCRTTVPRPYAFTIAETRFDLQPLGAAQPAEFSEPAAIGPMSVRSDAGAATAGRPSQRRRSLPSAVRLLVRWRRRARRSGPLRPRPVRRRPEPLLRVQRRRRRWCGHRRAPTGTTPPPTRGRSSPPSPTGSEGPSAACEAGRIHLIGGDGTNQHFVYDIATDTWTAAAPLPRGCVGRRGRRLRRPHLRGRRRRRLHRRRHVGRGGRLRHRHRRVGGPRRSHAGGDGPEPATCKRASTSTSSAVGATAPPTRTSPRTSGSTS